MIEYLLIVVLGVNVAIALLVAFNGLEDNIFGVESNVLFRVVVFIINVFVGVGIIIWYLFRTANEMGDIFAARSRGVVSSREGNFVRVLTDFSDVDF